MTNTVELAEMEPIDAAGFLIATLDGVQHELNSYSTVIQQRKLRMEETTRALGLAELGRQCVSDLTDLINENGLDPLGLTEDDASALASLQRKLDNAR